MNVPKRLIEEGDTVILFFNVVKMQQVEVTKQIVCKNGQKVKLTFLNVGIPITLLNFRLTTSFNVISEHYGSRVL